MTTILVSAGDLSGERYAANLVRAIRVLRPGASFVGMGGDAMSKAGVDLVVDQRELAVGGIFEALTSLSGVVRAWRRMIQTLRERQPDLVILIDSGGFNLPLARRVRQLSGAKILYYVAPQVWAWREGRVRKLARRTDRIAVILPLEKEFYAVRGVEVDLVGHPILGSPGDEASRSTLESSRSLRIAARRRIGLGPDVRVLGLFPGSRRSEIRLHLEIWIDTFRLLRRDREDLTAVIALAPSLDRPAFEKQLADLAGDLSGAIYVVSGDSVQVMRSADVALAKPGTVTLELLMQRCPMVVAGRVHPWTAKIVRRSLRADRLAMPNLLAGRDIVPEFIQERARPDLMADGVRRLFEGPDRERQIIELEAARELLGVPGAANRVAEIVEEMLGTPPT